MVRGGDARRGVRSWRGPGTGHGPEWTGRDPVGRGSVRASHLHGEAGQAARSARGASVRDGNLRALRHGEYRLLGAGRTAAVDQHPYLHPQVRQPGRGRDGVGSLPQRPRSGGRPPNGSTRTVSSSRGSTRSSCGPRTFRPSSRWRGGGSRRSTLGRETTQEVEVGEHPACSQYHRPERVGGPACR